MGQKPEKLNKDYGLLPIEEAIGYKTHLLLLQVNKEEYERVTNDLFWKYFQGLICLIVESCIYFSNRDL